MSPEAAERFWTRDKLDLLRLGCGIGLPLNVLAEGVGCDPEDIEIKAGELKLQLVPASEDPAWA